jgi:hypothetical protein
MARSALPRPKVFLTGCPAPIGDKLYRGGTETNVALGVTDVYLLTGLLPQVLKLYRGRWYVSRRGCGQVLEAVL